LPPNVNVTSLQFGLYAKPQQQPNAVAVAADTVGTGIINLGREVRAAAER
jgi:hypothetical protein